MLDIVAFGEILWDIIEGRPHIGGAPFNLAAHAVRCGLRAAVVSKVGDDPLGRAALAKMARLAVERSWTTVDQDHPTGTVTVKLVAGQPDYTIHQNVAWDFIQLSTEALHALMKQEPRAICFGTLAQRCEPSRQTLDRLLDASPAAVRFYDVNLRQSFWSESLVEASLARSTLVKTNDEEAHILGAALFDGATKPDDFGSAILGKYPRVEAVVVTRGNQGCVVCQRGQDVVRAPGVKVEVADAVGAGDAFSAAFLAAWLNGANGSAAARAGNQRGAWVASRPGAIPDEQQQLANQPEER